ncbi:type VI secretion system-associated protein TagF [Niveispirillum fermenti]|uniref:type VI secretion system-associated protein TagF n=1 Tax=Niveispirillum fermenti TaxID=1233113 RepID=UPI003A862936
MPGDPVMETAAPWRWSGLFGKLPLFGDFISRNVPAALVERLNGWVQAGMLRSRADLGDEWLSYYLCAPIWHFALAPGLCGPWAVAGVMIPSVDKASRHFPLLALAGRAGDLPALLAGAGGWYAQAESLLLTALADDLDWDALLAAVTGLAAGDADTPRPVALPGEGGTGDSLWWTQGNDTLPPLLLSLPGLPDPAGFAMLLGRPSPPPEPAQPP